MIYLIELLENQVHKLYIQGKRWSEVQLLKGMVFGVNAGRKMYLGTVGLMFFAMVLALSFCSTLLIGAYQLDDVGALYWNWLLGTSVIVFAVSALIFLITSRESLWLKATGVKHRMNELYGHQSDHAMKQGLHAGPAMDRAEMEYEVQRSVDTAVQRRMREEINILRDELREVLRDSQKVQKKDEIRKTVVVDEQKGMRGEVETDVAKRNRSNPPPIH